MLNKHYVPPYLIIVASCIIRSLNIKLAGRCEFVSMKRFSSETEYKESYA